MDDEQLLTRLLKQSDEKAFTLLFRQYYKDLVMFAGIFLSEKQACEDIVQSVFTNIWEKRMDLDINISFRSFLLKSVKNCCLDEFRHRKVVIEHENSVKVFENDANLEPEHYLLYAELQAHLNIALDQLPKKYRKVFEMSRLHGVKYKEIATKLNISVRTVEDRMAKAIKILHKCLKDFLPFFVFLYFL